MIKGTTSTGFKYEIRDDALNDWELVEDLSAIEQGDSSAIVRSLYRLLGKEQMTALKEHCRDKETGIVKITDIAKEQQEIMTANSDLKNS